MRPKRITPEQYLDLGKLGLPILATYNSQKELNRDAWILSKLQDYGVQEIERRWYKQQAEYPSHVFFTLVDD